MPRQGQRGCGRTGMHAMHAYVCCKGHTSSYTLAGTRPAAAHNRHLYIFCMYAANLALPATVRLVSELTSTLPRVASYTLRSSLIMSSPCMRQGDMFNTLSCQTDKPRRTLYWQTASLSWSGGGTSQTYHTALASGQQLLSLIAFTEHCCSPVRHTLVRYMCMCVC
jgi:hypothetical protein